MVDKPLEKQIPAELSGVRSQETAVSGPQNAIPVPPLIVLLSETLSRGDTLLTTRLNLETPGVYRKNVLEYTGQEKESDLGLYYYGARFYDPDTGRFLSVDAARQFWNSYSYVGNNPIFWVDPSGLHGESSAPNLELEEMYSDLLIVNINVDRHDPDNRRDVYIYYNKDDKNDVSHVEKRMLQAKALELRDKMLESAYQFSGVDAMAELSDYIYDRNGGFSKGLINDLALVLAGVGDANDGESYYIGNAFGDSGFKKIFADGRNQQRHFFGFLYGASRFGLLAYLHPNNLDDIRFGNTEDVNLTKAAVDASNKIAPHVGRIGTGPGIRLGEWMRKNLKEE